MRGDRTGELCLIAGGGTAGHVLPGLCVAEALVDRGHGRSEIHFVGSERGIDADLVPQAGFGLTTLPGRGIQRRFALANVAAAWGLVRALFQAIALVRRRRPHAVLAVGGYASVACALAAALWRVPLVVAEQNARAGMANKIAARFARACAVTFPGTDLRRSVVTGNPVRPEILAIDPGRDREPARRALGLPDDRTVLAVFSGSLGSQRINDAVRGALSRWAERDDLAIRHVVGKRDWERIGGDPPPLPDDGLVYQVVPYEDRMDLLLAASDLAVSRAGAVTVTELAAVGLPAVLVPLPIATRDHQTANGSYLAEAGAAVLVPDHELTTERLITEVEAILAEPARRDRMARAAAALARPDAADEIAALIEEHARA
jgi:undecaprenyldiphospho-muramoylpentapeptide beta-N-acetylglucosaminyltransferase